MNKISEFILDNENLLIPVLAIALVLFFAVFEKKRKLPVFSLVITGIALIGFIFTYSFPSLKLFGFPFLFFEAVLACLVLLSNFILYSIFNFLFYKRLKLVRVAANSIGNKVYAYLDSKARMIDFTEEFSYLLGLKKNKKKYYEEAISKIMVDSQEMGLNVFVHYIGTQEERDYRVAITLQNEKTLKLELKKRKVISEGNLLGYVLLSSGGGVAADTSFDPAVIYNYLNFLDEPIFYYDFKLRKYILTHEMMTLLGVTENSLGENNFLSVVVQEDLPLVSKRNLSDKVQKIHYRIKTVKGNFWFEESNINYEGQQYLVAHKTDFSSLKLNFYDQKSLFETAHLVYERNNWFAFVLVKILNFQKIKQQVGKDACEVILSRFFSQTVSELGYKNPKIYRLEDAVYAIILDKKEAYNRLLSILNTENNFILKAEINFNEGKYQIENALGIIASENAEDSKPDTALEAAYEALHLAEDPKYTQNYSIYLPKAKMNFDLGEMGIDLSDDFLDNIDKE